jgi:hypothetical protein
VYCWTHFTNIVAPQHTALYCTVDSDVPYVWWYPPRLLCFVSWQLIRNMFQLKDCIVTDCVVMNRYRP